VLAAIGSEIEMVRKKEMARKIEMEREGDGDIVTEE
jgi:hypothetical protein